jgi:sarcosine oxidase subunit delta
MKHITLDPIGTRPLSEFSYGGEVIDEPEGDRLSDREWAGYLFNADGAPGVKLEWWRHVPTGIWYRLRRDTVTDEFILDQPKGEAKA